MSVILECHLFCEVHVSAFEDPGAAGGIDVDSDLVTELAKECPNLAGIKLTYVSREKFCLAIH